MGFNRKEEVQHCKLGYRQIQVRAPDPTSSGLPFVPHAGRGTGSSATKKPKPSLAVIYGVILGKLLSVRVNK